MNMMTLYDNNTNEISNVNLSEETKITLPTTCLKINDKLLPSLPGLQRQLSIIIEYYLLLVLLSHFQIIEFQ